MRRLLRLLDRRDERGVTVLEISMALLILSILLVIAFDFLDRTSVIAVRTDSHARAEEETQRALRTVTQHLRGALPISGTCSTAGFPTGYDNCVRFDVPRVAATSGTCAVTKFVIGLRDDPSPTAPADEKLLRVDRQEVSGTTCDTVVSPPATVVLARVVNTSAQPLFEYFGSDGAEIQPTSVASVPNAATVRVSLHVRYRNGAKAIQLANTAALRNNISR